MLGSSVLGNCGKNTVPCTEARFATRLVVADRSTELCVIDEVTRRRGEYVGADHARSTRQTKPLSPRFKVLFFVNTPLVASCDLVTRNHEQSRSGFSGEHRGHHFQELFNVLRAQAPASTEIRESPQQVGRGARFLVDSRKELRQRNIQRIGQGRQSLHVSYAIAALDHRKKRDADPRLVCQSFLRPSLRSLGSQFANALAQPFSYFRHVASVIIARMPMP